VGQQESRGLRLATAYLVGEFGLGHPRRRTSKPPRSNSARVRSV